MTEPQAPYDAGPTIQTRLRARRVELGILQCDLAGRLRISRALMCRWERGACTPSVGRMLQWIDALGMTLIVLPQLKQYGNDTEANNK